MGLNGSFSIIELEYIGSYSARKVQEHTKAEHVRKQIKSIQKKKGFRKTPVLLIVTGSGVKITDRRGQVVLVANSLFQIKYCAYLREDRVFCFLSRESSRYEEVHQYIHVFTTARSEVDEVNANIRNAFSLAKEEGTSIASKNSSKESKTTPEVSRLTRSLSLQPTRQTPLSPTSPTSLSASFSSAPLREVPRERLKTVEESTNQTTDQEQSSNGSTLRQIVVRSASKRMLKHTVSAQAKLESSKEKKASSGQTAPGSKNRLLSRRSSQGKTTSSKNNLSLPITSSGKTSPSCSKPDDLNCSPSSCLPPTSPQSFSTSPMLQVQKNSSSTYAKIKKSPSPLPATVPSSPAAGSRTKVFSDNLAYLRDDESSSDSPLVPDSIYGRLQSTESAALPPPRAFSDCDAVGKVVFGSEAFKDYIDIDKASLNNNNSDTLSFYSDNYMRPGALALGRTGSTTHRHCSPQTASIYSSSSGISVNSFEGELMHGRPLPLTPENELSSNMHRNGSTTPLRYQNDSPFVTAASATHDRMSPRPSTRTESPQPSQTTSAKQRSAEELLKQVPWFRPKMTREQVLESLSREDLGTFIIRESSTHDTCFALSVKVPKFNNPTGIAHYIIHRTPSQGFKLKGLEKEWTNLSSLVIHHTIMPELLPCTLKIPRLQQSRRHSTASKTSNSSLGSSDSSPSLDPKRPGNSHADRLAQTLEKRLNITSYPEAV